MTLHLVSPRFLLLPVCAALALWSGLAGATEPAQIPLSSRVAEPPPPNVMVTVDDSGSMLADFMPEGNFTLNGKTVNLANTKAVNSYIGGFPNDKRKSDAGLYDCVALGNIANTTSAFQRQFRSPDVNAIFYNPDTTYLPWVAPSGGRLAQIDYTKAPLDPTSPTETRDLTATQLGLNTKWCETSDKVVTGKRDFHPGLVYRLKSGADPTLAASYVGYNVADKDKYPTKSSRHENRDDCASKTSCTHEEELQNFANWFTYYRMRETLTKAAISESLSQYVDKLRIGWARINKTDSYNVDGGKKVSRVETAANGGPIRPFNATRMSTVFTGVQALRSANSTPLRTSLDAIGSYFSRTSAQQKGSPWLEDPSNTSSTKLSCRRSVNLLMTDGYYNDTYDAAGDVDGVQGTDYSGLTNNPNGYSPTQYLPETPFIDGPPSVSNTLADVAMRYYKTDLEPTIQNGVWTISGDIAFWQHLTQFTVGIGVRGTLDSSKDQKAATLAALKAGTLKWPDPLATGALPQHKIDDMWHAAVNTGGDFYSVANVTELTEALSDAFGKAAGKEAKEAGVATAAPFTTADNVKYVPKYKSVSWYGDLEAYELEEDGDQESLKWIASDRVPAAASRNLFTWDGSSAVNFTWSAMGAANQTLVGSEALTDFIRGDHTNEGDGKAYRDRGGKVLGDFVNSPPVLVGNYLNLGYEAFDSTYTDYRQSKRDDRDEPLIVVGGNDGMVHFFRGSDGTEVFGFLPRAGLSKLNLIAAKDYGTNDNFHQFFVDGPMTETDAKINGAWTNMVLGAMGAGGKSFFAMRVPTAYGALDSNDFGASTVMWEKSGDSDADIGYMFADFAAGKIKDGGWKAFIGNGVYSTNGDAVLLVVDMETGNIDARLKVDDGGDTGLMGVTLIKDETTREVVGAYAGDLKGNLWRFDFEGGTTAQWKVGFNGDPLFVATGPTLVRQPITAPPVYVTHPKGGRVVLFGTGRLIDEADSETTSVQSYYGVWDDTTAGVSSATLPSPFLTINPDRSVLQAQVIDTDPIEERGGTFYVVNTTEVDWDTQKGWYMDLPWSRQRVVYPTVVLAGEYVYISTLVPAAPAAQCDVSTGEGYNFLLRAVDGNALTEALFDTDGDGDIDSADVVVQGVKTNADGKDSIIRKGGDEDDEDGECVNGWRTYYRTDTTGKSQMMRVPCTVPATGPKDRVWKQLVNPPTAE